MQKIIAVAVACGVLLAGGGVFYHYVIFLPDRENRKEAAAAELKRAEEARILDRNANYSACLELAAKSYTREWDKNCASLNRGRDCSLPLSVANAVDRAQDDRKDRCMREATHGLN